MHCYTNSPQWTLLAFVCPGKTSRKAQQWVADTVPFALYCEMLLWTLGFGWFSGSDNTQWGMVWVAWSLGDPWWTFCLYQSPKSSKELLVKWKYSVNKGSMSLFLKPKCICCDSPIGTFQSTCTSLFDNCNYPAESFLKEPDCHLSIKGLQVYSWLRSGNLARGCESPQR